MKYPLDLYSAHNISLEQLEDFLSENKFTYISRDHWGHQEGGIWIWKTDIDNPFYYLAKGFNINDYAVNIDHAIKAINETKYLCDEAIDILARLGSAPKSIFHLEFKPERIASTLEIIRKIQKLWPSTVPGNELYEVFGTNYQEIERIMKTRAHGNDHQ